MLQICLLSLFLWISSEVLLHMFLGRPSFLSDVCCEAELSIQTVLCGQKQVKLLALWKCSKWVQHKGHFQPKLFYEILSM